MASAFFISFFGVFLCLFYYSVCGNYKRFQFRVPKGEKAVTCTVEQCTEFPDFSVFQFFEYILVYFSSFNFKEIVVIFCWTFSGREEKNSLAISKNSILSFILPIYIYVLCCKVTARFPFKQTFQYVFHCLSFEGDLLL